MEDFADEKMRLSDENEEYRDCIIPDTEDDEEEQQKKAKDVDAHNFSTPKESKRKKRDDGEKNPQEEHRHRRRSKKKTKKKNEKNTASLKSQDVPKGTNGTSGSCVTLESMIDELKEEGIEFDLIDKQRVPVLLEAWRSLKVAELETRLKEAVYKEELFNSILILK
jgi:hypothetical protein